MVGREGERGAYDTTRTREGKRGKDTRDESVLESFASSLRGRIDTKFLSNRRDLLYMNDNRRHRNARPHIEI